MVTVLQNMMGQARGQVLSKTPEGRMKEEQRLKINQGVQSGESLLRAETCLDDYLPDDSLWACED